MISRVQGSKHPPRRATRPTYRRLVVGRGGGFDGGRISHPAGDPPALEPDSETELHRTRPVRDVRVVDRPPEQRAVNVGRERSEVVVTQHVEYLEDAVNGAPPSEADALLQPHIDAMERGPNEAVALDDRSVVAPTRAAGLTGVAYLAGSAAHA